MRIKAIILAVLAFVLVLSGCGNNTDTNSNASTSDELITEEIINPEDVEPEEIIPLSTEVVLPENINTESLVDTENEINASVSNTTREETKQYVQTLVDAGYNLDYKFEVEEGAQYSLSTNEITVSVLFKNDEMTIYATRFE